MDPIIPNENGNYEYTQEEYTDLQDHIMKIEAYLKMVKTYCEFYEFEIGQIYPILYMSELVLKEAKCISCRF